MPAVIGSTSVAIDGGSLTLEHAGAVSLAVTLAAGVDQAFDAGDLEVVALLARELRALLEGLGMVVRLPSDSDPIEDLLRSLSGAEGGDGEGPVS
jgi:hypothetical protein